MYARDLGETYPKSVDCPDAKNYLQKKKAAAQQSQAKLRHHVIITLLRFRNECLKAGLTARAETFFN